MQNQSNVKYLGIIEAPSTSSENIMQAQSGNVVEQMAELLSSANFQVPGNEQSVTRIAAIPQGSVVIDPSAIQAIRDFAKANKVGAQKFEEFVTKLFQQEIPKHVEKVAPQVVIRGGRPMKVETQQLRKDVATWLKKVNRNPERPHYVTSKDIAGHFGVALADANNTLRFLANTGLVQEKGQQENLGKKGRKLTLWGLSL